MDISVGKYPPWAQLWVVHVAPTLWEGPGWWVMALEEKGDWRIGDRRTMMPNRKFHTVVVKNN